MRIAPPAPAKRRVFPGPVGGNVGFGVLPVGFDVGFAPTVIVVWQLVDGFVAPVFVVNVAEAVNVPFC